MIQRCPIVLFWVSCAGCLTALRVPNYSVDLAAEANLAVTEFSVEYSGFRGVVQDFGVSAGMKYLSIGAHLPQTASCTWTGASGEVRRVDVPVRTCLPARFDPRGDGLIFTVTSNNCISFSVYLRDRAFGQEKVLVARFPSE